MALIKEKQTKFGVTANYWRVGMISIDRHRKEASYSLELYLSKDADEFIESHSVSLLGMEDKTEYELYFNNLNKNIIKTCYEHAKAKVDYFKTAIDG